jgi:hypothetical protein
MWYGEFWQELNSLTEVSVPELCTWQHNETSLSDRLTNHAKSDAKDLGFQSNTIYYGSRMATTISIPNIPSMTSSEKGWAKMCKSITSSRKSRGLAQPLGVKECDTLRWNRAEAIYASYFVDYNTLTWSYIWTRYWRLFLLKFWTGMAW